MEYNPDNNDHGLPYNPFKSLIVPRPIGWISTVDEHGNANLAPYSAFNMCGYAPPMVMFASGGHPPDFRPKDTVLNAENTGEFVCNIVSWDLREAMSKTAEVTPPGVDEFALAGLEKEPSSIVRAPRVKGAPVHMECRYICTTKLPGHTPENDNVVVFGQVVWIHIDDDLITPDGLVDIGRIRPVSRLGYMDYSSVPADSIFAMKKLLPESGQVPGEEGSGMAREMDIRAARKVVAD